jgi:ABC transporter substrate binding protein
MPRASARAARGRLIAQGTACWRACAERCEARKARIERLSVGREKNLYELTRAHPSGDDKDDRLIGFLGLQPASAFAPRIEALRQGLRELGYVEGKNLLIDFQWADTVDQLPGIVRRLVDSRVDLIFAPSSTWVEPARQATKTIPIVFANHGDPVGLGHVESLAHPGGNITGLSMVFTEIAAKELEILHEATPQAKRIGVFWNPTNPSHEPALKAVRAGAEMLGVKLYEERRVESRVGLEAQNRRRLASIACTLNSRDAVEEA